MGPVAGVAYVLRCVGLSGHSRRMNEDEAKTVAAVAAQCLTWGGWRRWGLVMLYGRLFTPGADVGGGARRMLPEEIGRHAYRRAGDSGLLYAEGYACYPLGMHVPRNWAWCLDGETVVDLGSEQPSTAYFGVALRPGYVRRVRAAQRNDDGSDGFTWAFTHHEVSEVIDPPLDSATDIVPDIGRDIPSSVRDWALTSERHPGGAENPRPGSWTNCSGSAAGALLIRQIRGCTTSAFLLPGSACRWSGCRFRVTRNAQL